MPKFYIVEAHKGHRPLRLELWPPHNHHMCANVDSTELLLATTVQPSFTKQVCVHVHTCMHARCWLPHIITHHTEHSSTILHDACTLDVRLDDSCACFMAGLVPADALLQAPCCSLHGIINCTAHSANAASACCATAGSSCPRPQRRISRQTS